MKTFKTLLSVLGVAACGAAAHAQSFAPVTNIVNTFFNGMVTSSTGGANGNGAFTELFTGAGQDYTVSSSGMLSAPAAYTYANTGANTGTIKESGVTVNLTFTSSIAGTFAADYGNGVTQAGTFTLGAMGSASALTNASVLFNVVQGGSPSLGFVVTGVSHTVLIRAVGPGLVPFGVNGVLATPSITLWNGGNVIATNSGWNNDAKLQAAFTQGGAFNLASGSKDSAIVMTLAPGAYTAQVKSTSATDSGNVLIEIYFIN